MCLRQLPNSFVCGFTLTWEAQRTMTEIIISPSFSPNGTNILSFNCEQ